MDKDKIKEILFDELGEKKSLSWREKGDKYFHGLRVASLALELRRRVVPEDGAFDDILYAASLFHDVRGGFEDHERIGAVRTRELISEYLTPSEMDQVCALIETHDDRKCDRASLSVWQKLLQDADLLDHHGSFQIFETFMGAPFSGNTIAETARMLMPENSFKETRSERALNFEESRKICRERDAFARAFARRFAYEAGGGLWETGVYLK